MRKNLVIAVVLATLVAVLPSLADASGSAGSSATRQTTTRLITHPVRVFRVHGYGYPTRRWYRLALWKKSDTHACAKHSYGLAIKRYFRRDPCRDDTRYLYTTTLHRRRVVLEVESLVVGVLPNDPNGTRSAGRLIELLNSPGTGSVNDLLREGWRIPHVGPGIPRHEVFRVHGEDSGVVVFDAWYAQHYTADNDRALVEMENQLFLTRATEAHFAAAAAAAAGSDAVQTDLRRSGTRVIADCFHLSTRPRRIIFACGDGASIAVRLQYRRWGRKSAAGSGKLALETCDPSCATGGIIRYPMRFVLRRVRGAAGRRVFTRMAMTFTRRHPPGLGSSVTWRLLTTPLG